MSRSKQKGVFCLEGYWYGDHRDTTSMEPVLQLVQKFGNVPYLHHRCTTLEEFVASIKRWKIRSFNKKYPILYIGFHGDKGLIKVGKQKITIQELATLLGDKCSGAIIHFGSCSTMKFDRRLLMNFMEKTKVLGIMGYMQDVDWLLSASFEILLLSHLQDLPFDTQGMKTFNKNIHLECRRQMNELKFRILINERFIFQRKRKKIK
ncbi:MAG: DUF6642 family protein [Ferruginibacter sp.]